MDNMNSFIPSSTYIKEIDIKIYSDVPPDILLYLCQTNKYIKFISPSIWKIKIEELYPGFPIPIAYKNRLTELYFKISDSYVQLKDFATKNGYCKILDWLDIPINKVNWIIEFGVKKGEQFPKLGDVAGYRMQQRKELEELLEDGIYPTQKSVNISMSVGNTRMIATLIDYGLFPDQEFINIAAQNGNFVDKLLKYDLLPDQESINIAAENGHYFENLGKLYNIFPDQDSINIATENGQYYLLYDLAQNNKYPDQLSIDIATKKGFGDVVEVLTEHNIFPSQEAINVACKKGYDNIIDVLEKYEIYPDI